MRAVFGSPDFFALSRRMPGMEPKVLGYATPKRPWRMGISRESIIDLLLIAFGTFWAICWMPFGIAYYDSPWSVSAFRIFIQIWGWAIAIASFAIGIQSLRRGRRKWPALTCFAESIFSLVAMYMWMRRF